MWTCFVIILSKYVNYLFRFVFITLYGFINTVLVNLALRLHRFKILDYDNFSIADVSEKWNTYILHSVILRGFLHFVSQLFSNIMF